MSGHSKWATTKRAKAIVDAKRGAAFTKIGNIISIAARKGGDPTTNFSLRMAIEKARGVNMPKENIERAIKRGTGEGGGAAIEEIIYEGIGPAKSQFIVKTLTDNKNRSAAVIRHLFTDAGGAFGSVGWNFSQKGVIRIMNDELRIKNLLNEEFELELIDQGVQDINKEEEGWTVYTETGDLQKVKQYLEAKGIVTESADIEYIAKETAVVTGEDKEKVEKFIEALEDNEDVSDYYTNTNI
jgi:YebC/PmpR family DNA-binding regulatory protein